MEFISDSFCTTPISKNGSGKKCMKIAENSGFDIFEVFKKTLHGEVPRKPKQGNANNNGKIGLGFLKKYFEI